MDHLNTAIYRATSDEQTFVIHAHGKRKRTAMVTLQLVPQNNEKLVRMEHNARHGQM